MVRKGWRQVTLGDIALFQGGSQPPLSVFSSQKKAGYIRLVQIRDYKTDKHATYIPEKLAKRFCKQDDIMIGRYGPPIFQILRGIEGAYNVALIKALPQGVDKEFLYHTLKREDLFEYIDLLSRRTSGQTGVDLTNLKAFELSIPVLTDEQATIAKALSDVDSLISSLQKLIEKKKAIKQGAMQELLTGQKRLPGFSVEWSQAPFENLFDFLPTNAFTRDQMTDIGTIQNVHYGDILTKYGACLDMANTDVPYLLETVSVRKYSESSYVREGDVIIADTAEDSTVGKCVELVNVYGKVLSGQHTMLCRPKVTFAPKFLGYYMNAGCFHNQMLPFITGIKVSSISKANISTLVLKYPTLVEEQQAIAQVFSDMDEEIAQLEKKLAKYQQIKQGMMQELLTGRIRLKEGENSA